MNTLMTPKFYLELNNNPALQDLFNRFNMEVIPNPSIARNLKIQTRVKEIIKQVQEHSKPPVPTTRPTYPVR